MKNMLIKVFASMILIIGMAVPSTKAFAWGPSDHQTCVSKGFNEIELSEAEKAALLFGSIFPDIDDKYKIDEGKGTLHGTLWTKNANGFNANYIGNYLYLTKIASLLGADAEVKLNTVNKDYGMYAKDFTILNGYVTYNCNTNDDNGGGKVGNYSWNEIFAMASENGVTVLNTPANRKAFIIGVALHGATDVFSHSTWTTDSKNAWRRITHDDTGYGITGKADKADFKSKRLEAAEQVSKNILTTIYANYNSVGKVSDFIVSDDCFTGDQGNFRIGNYAYYAQVSGKTTGETTAYTNFIKGDVVCQSLKNNQICSYYYYANYDYSEWCSSVIK